MASALDGVCAKMEGRIGKEVLDEAERLLSENPILVRFLEAVIAATTELTIDALGEGFKVLASVTSEEVWRQVREVG